MIFSETNSGYLERCNLIVGIQGWLGLTWSYGISKFGGDRTDHDIIYRWKEGVKTYAHETK